VCNYLIFFVSFFFFLAVLRLLLEQIALVACRLITNFAYVMIMAGLSRFFRDSYYGQFFDDRDRATEAD
jgi:hypothetical protein